MKTSSQSRTKSVLFALIALFVAQGLVGCATNPVTGETELGLVSRDSELDMGRQQYASSRQQEGGDFQLDPALTRYVREVGAKLAAVADRDLPYEFAIVNDSTPNAWALPGGKIAVNRGLLTELDSEAELAAVLAHEIVHAAARHGAQGVERGTLLSGAILATAVLLGGSEYRDLAMAGAQIGASAMNQKYGRDAEREADYYGIKYMARAGYDPAAAVDLQQTFVRLNDERRQDWLSGLFASHPPSQERVDNNRKDVAVLPSRPPIRARRPTYQRIAYLKRVKPAYDAYDKGREALAKSDVATAEAGGQGDRHRAARGPVPQPQGRCPDQARRLPGALSRYDSAVRRDATYFRHYLMRGLVREETRRQHGCRSDLERSINLLPTKTAQDHLVRLNAYR